MSEGNEPCVYGASSCTLKSLANTSNTLSVKQSTIGKSNRTVSYDSLVNSEMPSTSLNDLLIYPPDIISTTIERKANPFWRFTSEAAGDNNVGELKHPHKVKRNKTRRKSKTVSTSAEMYEEELISHSRCSDDTNMSVTSEVDYGLIPLKESLRSIGIQAEQPTLNEYVQVSIGDSGPVFDLKRENANLKGRLESVNYVVEEMSKERSGIQTKMHSLEKELKTKISDYNELLSAKQRMLIENEDLKRGLSKWEKIVSEYQEVIENKITEVNGLKEDLISVEKENETMKVTTEQLRADVEKRDNDSKELKGLLSEKELEIENFSKKVVRLQDEMKYLNNEISSKCEQRDHYLNEITKLQLRLTETQQKMILDQTEIFNMKSNCEKLQNENIALKQDLLKVKQKAYEEKQLLMKNLETIEADLLETGSANRLFSTVGDIKISNNIDSANMLFASKESEINTLKKELEELRSSNSCLMHDKQVLTNRVEHLQKSLSDREFEFSTEKSRANELETKMKGMKSELKTLRDFNEMLRKEKIGCEEKLTLLIRDNKLLENSTRSLKDNVEKHERIEKQMRGELIAKEKKLEIAEKERFKLEHLVSVKEDELKSMKQVRQTNNADKIDAYNCEVQLKKEELEKVVDSLSKELKSLQVKFEHQESSLKEDIDKWRDTVRVISLENESVKNDLKFVKEEKAKLEYQIGELENEKKYFKDLSHNLESRIIPTEDKSQLNHSKDDSDKLKLLQSNFKLVLRKYKEAKQTVQTLESQLATQSQPEKTLEDFSTQTETNELEYLHNEVENLKLVVEDKQRIIEENEKIILKFEHERGKIINSEDTSFKQQISSLESIIFSRNAEVSELNSSLREAEEKHNEDLLKLNKKIENLEEELKKERALLKDLRRCVFLEKRDNNQFKRDIGLLKKALSDSNQIADKRKQEATLLENKLEEQKQIDIKLHNEIDNLNILLNKAKIDFENLKAETQQSQRRDGTLMQEVMNLSLSLKDRTQQIQSLKLDMETMQKRFESEKKYFLDKLDKSQIEVESLKNELSAARKEKFSYQSKVGDLRAALKSTLEQNKKISSKIENTSFIRDESENDIINRIINQDHMSGDGKKPLVDLQSCVESLKLEMESLQQQIKEYED